MYRSFLSGSEFVEMFVGVGASESEICLKKPRKMHRVSCLLMRLDAIGKSRDSDMAAAMMSVNRH